MTYGNLCTLNGNMINSGRSVRLIASRAMLFVKQLWNQVPVSGTYRYYGGLLQFMLVLHASCNFRFY